MTIYARTEEGQRAAYSPDSALPRKLRSFLVLVDGKTASEDFQDKLSSFGDVDGLLRSFSLAGLIHPVVQVPVAAAAANGHSNGAASPAAAPDILSAWEPLGPPTVPFFMHTDAAPRSSNSPTEAARKNALTHAIVMMTNFVELHDPKDAREVVRECQQIHSLEQLAATLGGYEQRIAHLGEPAQSHLLDIRLLLQEHL